MNYKENIVFKQVEFFDSTLTKAVSQLGSWYELRKLLKICGFTSQIPLPKSVLRKINGKIYINELGLAALSFKNRVMKTKGLSDELLKHSGILIQDKAVCAYKLSIEEKRAKVLSDDYENEITRLLLQNAKLQRRLR